MPILQNSSSREHSALAHNLESIEGSIENLSVQISSLQAALTTTADVSIAEQLPYTIPHGHAMFGYTGSNGIPIDEAFIAATGNENIGDQISILKNQVGQFWSPQYGYASLASMVNGGGYYIYNSGSAFTVTWS